MVWAFVIYTLAWETLVWVGGLYVILAYDWSAWWVCFLLLLSACQLKPSTFRELTGAANDEGTE